jgi:hypothetical protein
VIGLLVGLSAPALADEDDAETCVRAKVRESWAEGWSVRTGAKATLSATEHHVYAVTLQEGNHYRVTGCGDSRVADLDLVIYDSEAAVIVDDKTDDRQPEVELVAPVTGTYYVVVYVGATTEPSPAGVATIVTFR